MEILIKKESDLFDKPFIDVFFHLELTYGFKPTEKYTLERTADGVIIKQEVKE